MLGADYLVRKGVIPIYTDWIQAEKYWKENIQFKKIQGNKKEMEIMDRKIKDVIAKYLEMDKKLLKWSNQLVLKSNRDYQLLIKNDFTISTDLTSRPKSIERNHSPNSFNIWVGLSI
jgi:hypothetical protein